MRAATKMLDFDDALEEIGEFGRFQIVNYLLLCLPLLFSAANGLTYIFTAGVPNYRCHIDDCDDPNNAVFSQPWLQNVIPGNSKDGPYIPSQCNRYVPHENLSETNCGDESDFFHNVTVPCDRWVFEDNERTIVGEWNITCIENQWKLSMVGTVHFLGIFVGTIIFGFLADSYGRKLVFIFCIVLMSLTGVAQAISTDYITFQIFVFINALGTSGVYPLAFILGVELVGRRKREMSGVIINYFYAVGESALGLIAWMSKDWVTIQLVVSVPPAIFIIYYWLIPESVRWLLAKKDTKKAAAIMKQAAKMNGVELSRDLLTIMEADNHEEIEDSAGTEDKSITWTAVKELLRSKVLVIRSLLLFYIWSANAFVYYGLSVNSTTLGGNKYFIFSLVCLVEIPAYTISWFTLNKLGRRWSFAGSMLLCAITCLAAAFVPDDMSWAVILLFLTGKLGITMSFGIAYVYTAELYPTVIRSIGVGACSTLGRLGALVAPFAPLLGHFIKPLPLILFSVISFVAAIFALGLPETLGTKLPDTVSEAETLKLVVTASTSEHAPMLKKRKVPEAANT